MSDIVDKLLKEADPDLSHLVVAVDFDGTCCVHAFPELGRDIGAGPVLRELVSRGARLVLWTMRSGDTLAVAERWFDAQGVPLFGVNRNPEQDEWTTSPKAYAHVYIDDAALGAPLKVGLPGERPHIDWEAVRRWFFGETPLPDL